ncbi:MAG TPA: GNAT family N-acetyltransferase [Candidatus Limnocylindria bacterium]|jgi:GNAT superfamily N-acetyltransferase|nr:GNAT family N-acetyltransferase [Candidatus Limnocylindria bacterium]
MTHPAPDIRPGTAADSRPAFDVFLAAVTDLSARLGSPWDAKPDELWPRLEPMFALLAAHAAEWWVAQDGDGRVIGYARSVERGGLFELSEMFVLPDRQAAGIGRELLRRAFPLGRGDLRAIIATTDVRAQANYYRAGTAARFPIASLLGRPGVATGSGPLDPPLEAVAVTQDDVPALLSLERDAIEFDRGDEMRWLVEQRKGFLYRRAGRVVGSGFMTHRGGIGPVVSISARDMPGILDHLERCAADLELEEITLDVPGPNEAALLHLLDRRLQLDPFFTLLMSSRPFGDFARFIGFAPPFVL